MNKIREDAYEIIDAALNSAKPDEAVKRALKQLHLGKGKLFLLAVGKAAWQMSKTAAEELQNKIDQGICITKYGHVLGEIQGIQCYEAGHPVLDDNSVIATKAAEEMVNNLEEEDTVLFLVSGGGSALFEDPLITLSELQDITSQLLASGADITEINTIRKRLSKVKGGKFARMCEPAKVFSIILSDIIGDPLDMIASGPAYPDSSTCNEAMKIVKKYQLTISEHVQELLMIETPKKVNNVKTCITGSVKQLCAAAIQKSQELGYKTVFLTASLDCEAKEAGRFLSAIARDHQDTNESLAIICGGETIVHLIGHGRGGRNQELVLSAAEKISGLKDTLIFSVGSDGTDGPTDAAGGIVCGETQALLQAQNISISDVLNNNDAYNALKKVDGLIITGPTGTNVNDLSVVLIRR